MTAINSWYVKGRNEAIAEMECMLRDMLRADTEARHSVEWAADILRAKTKQRAQAFGVWR